MYNLNSIYKTAFCLASVLLFPSMGTAITLDRLTAAQTLIASPANPVQNEVINSTSAIGGQRSLRVINVGATNVLASIGGGNLTYGEVNSVGTSILTYDADDSSIDFLNQVSNPAGLGGIDFTDDEGTKIIINITYFDYPFSTPMPIKVRIYDASDVSGNTWSEWTKTISQEAGTPANPNPVALEFPFASFPVSGPNGPADFTNVGAVQIVINGSTQANDLQISNIKTDGKCTLVPQVGAQIVDDCGMCEGTNQDKDQCGICTNAIFDVNKGNPLPNHDPNYVPNSLCADCLGVPNGTAVPGAKCETGLFGICLGGKFDANCACKQDKLPGKEICNNTDDDCDGKIDDGLNFVCGVCEGDGSSCGCNDVNQSAELRALDGGAKRQERAIRNAAHRMTPFLDKKSDEYIFLQKSIALAHEYMIENWTRSWTLPIVNTTCSNVQFCVSTSTLPILNSYRDVNKKLRDLFNTVYKRLGKFRKARGGSLTKDDRKLRKLSDKYFSENQTRANSIPTENFACT